ISSEVIFSEEFDKKEKALNASELVKRGYKSADNPIFKVFYMEHGTATISDFSGKPPKRVEF
ncbi:MAG: pyridoxamine 5'-phosphate oxidase, partial [Bacteroidota bacterium]|nr:pyridoxamine 5'-phosphate oxidase [Bacteroidota bacterium]